jgi:hypothetical protein
MVGNKLPTLLGLAIMLAGSNKVVGNKKMLPIFTTFIGRIRC